MKISATQILAVGAVGIAGYLVYRGTGAVQAAAQAVNPVNPDNVANRTAHGVLPNVLRGLGFPQAAARVEGSSIGSTIYDIFNPIEAAYDPNEAIRGPLQ